jgi:hypothetical protein
LFATEHPVSARRFPGINVECGSPLPLWRGATNPRAGADGAVVGWSVRGGRSLRGERSGAVGKRQRAAALHSANGLELSSRGATGRW